MTVGAAEAVNIGVRVGDGVCFKGAELRFIRGPVPVAPPVQIDRSAVPGQAPDGTPTR